MGNYGGAWKREENKPVRLKQKQAVHFLQGSVPAEGEMTP